MALAIDSDYHKLPRFTDKEASDDTSSFPKAFLVLYMGNDRVTQQDEKEDSNEISFDKNDDISVSTNFSSINARQWKPDGNTLETFPVPRGVQMATEFRSYQSMHHHRKKWIQVLKELHGRELHKNAGYPLDIFPLQKKVNDSVIKFEDYGDAFYSDRIIDFSKERELKKQKSFKEHIKESNKYKIINESEIKILINHNSKQGSLNKYLNTNRLSWIPTIYTFFVSEVYKNHLPNIHPSSSVSINLSNLGICDNDLIPKRSARNLEPILSPYIEVILSQNRITGIQDYFFSNFITKLIIDENSLLSLLFLKKLTALEYLDVSKNTLSNLSGLEFCVSLKILNISNNIIKNKDIQQIGSLSSLEKLDISDNQLERLLFFGDSIKSFTSLTSLKANNNNLTKFWKDIFTAADKLSILEVMGNKELILSKGKNFDPQDFKNTYPALITLKTDQGNHIFAS